MGVRKAPATLPSQIELDHLRRIVRKLEASRSDVAAEREVHGIVGELAAGGVAVVLIPDEVPEIYVHAWRILVIRQGQQPAAM